METIKTILVSKVFYYIGGRMERDELVRKRILKSSLRLFYSRGFSRVTTQEIAGALGISKKTLYTYFSSKNEIVMAALSANFEGLGKRIDAVFNEEDRPFDWKLTALLSISRMQISNISLVLIEDMHRYLPEAWEMIDRFRREHLLNRLGRLIRQGKEEGFIRNSIDVDAALFLVFGIINHVFRPENLINQKHSTHSLFSTFISLLYGGLFEPERFEEFSRAMDIFNLEELHVTEGDFIE